MAETCIRHLHTGALNKFGYLSLVQPVRELSVASGARVPDLSIRRLPFAFLRDALKATAAEVQSNGLQSPRFALSRHR